VASSSNAVEETPPAPITEQDMLDVEHGHVIDQWMKETSSQLTFYGLTKLHEELEEGQLYVFFRNNHFSTLLVREASLWLLVTDQGFAKQAAIWEKLDTVDGDSFFVTANFDEFRMDGSTPYHHDTNIDGQDTQASLDEQLAHQLQEAEHRKAERTLAQSHQPKRSAPPPSSSNPQGRPLNQSTPGRAPPNPANNKGKKEDDDCTIL